MRAPSGLQRLGYGESSDAFHMSSPDPEGRGAIASMQAALTRAGVDASLVDYTDAQGRVHTAAEQWAGLDAFIRQDNYLNKHRGEIAERFGGVNGWYSDVDLRILQDIGLYSGAKRHSLQLSLDVLNVGSGEWGIAAVTRIGMAYSELAKGIVDSPDPRGLNEEQRGMYRSELTNLALPLEEKAIEAYDKALGKAYELSIYN